MPFYFYFYFFIFLFLSTSSILNIFGPSSLSVAVGSKYFQGHSFSGSRGHRLPLCSGTCCCGRTSGSSDGWRERKGVLMVTSLTPTTSWCNATVTQRRGNRQLTFLSDEPTWSYFCIVSRLSFSLPNSDGLVTLKDISTARASLVTCCSASRSRLCHQEAGNLIIYPS